MAKKKETWQESVKRQVQPWNKTTFVGIHEIVERLFCTAFISSDVRMARDCETELIAKLQEEYERGYPNGCPELPYTAKGIKLLKGREAVARRVLTQIEIALRREEYNEDTGFYPFEQ